MDEDATTHKPIVADSDISISRNDAWKVFEERCADGARSLTAETRVIAPQLHQHIFLRIKRSMKIALRLCASDARCTPLISAAN